MASNSKKIAGSIAGLITALVLIMLLERLSGTLYPPPATTRQPTIEELELFIASAPFGAVALLLLSYLTGAFAGGFVGTLLARPSWVPALVVGLFLTMGSVVNLLMVKHPAGYWAMLAIYLPGALAGAKLAMKKPAPVEQM